MDSAGRRMTKGWVGVQVQRVLSEARKYHGASWDDFSAAQRERACAPGLVALLTAQHEQYEDTLTKLQEVCHEVARTLGTE